MPIDLEVLKSSPEYQTLIRKRRSLILPLAVVTVVAYMAFILAIAFEPKSLGTPVGDGVLSIGIVLGLLLILLNFVITLIYVTFANRDLEPLIARVHALAGEK